MEIFPAPIMRAIELLEVDRGDKISKMEFIIVV
jgi:hypothetical protein